MPLWQKPNATQLLSQHQLLQRKKEKESLWIQVDPFQQVLVEAHIGEEQLMTFQEKCLWRLEKQNQV